MLTLELRTSYGQAVIGNAYNLKERGGVLYGSLRLHGQMVQDVPLMMVDESVASDEDIRRFIDTSDEPDSRYLLERLYKDSITLEGDHYFWNGKPNIKVTSRELFNLRRMMRRDLVAEGTVLWNGDLRPGIRITQTGVKYLFHWRKD